MAVNTVNTLTVTNDHAERRVALIEVFNRALTHTEEQAQYLLSGFRASQKNSQRQEIYPLLSSMNNKYI